MNVERSCRSKQVHLSKDHAKAVVRLMGGRHREQFHLYRCEARRYVADEDPRNSTSAAWLVEFEAWPTTHQPEGRGGDFRYW